MKLTLLFLSLSIFSFVSCKQHCPDPAPNNPVDLTPMTSVQLITTLGSETQIAALFEHLPTGSFPTYTEMFVGEWTHTGWYMHRFLLKPDLSSIPTKAIIDSAFVIFYPTDNATSSNAGGYSNNVADNAMFIENITTSWSSNTVSWNTQPATTATDRISVPSTADGDVSSGKIYISSLLKAWVATPSAYNGMLLKAQDESTHLRRRVLYASPYHSNSSLHPLLKVYYRK